MLCLSRSRCWKLKYNVEHSAALIVDLRELILLASYQSSIVSVLQYFPSGLFLVSNNTESIIRVLNNFVFNNLHFSDFFSRVPSLSRVLSFD